MPLAANVPAVEGTLVELPGGTFRPYQAETVPFIQAHSGRALLADEVGLGKTLQVLAWLHAHPERRPALVVCPANVKLQWQRQVLRWLGVPPEEVWVLDRANGR